MNAPVALFCFNRPDLLAQTLAALKQNPEASQTRLYAFSDGARDKRDIDAVNTVRAQLREIEGFLNIEVIEREHNIGLADNIISGVSYVLSKHDNIIVLEDDIKVSPHFLSFMNQALERYCATPYVWHISGWNYPIDSHAVADMFFWRVMNCWGWATWSDRWQYFRKDANALVKSFTTDDIYTFNLDGSHNFWKQVCDNEQGKINTWAIFWYATIFSHNGLCLNPSQTLVDNIGFTTGTNCLIEKNYVDKLNPSVPSQWPEVVKESKPHVQRIRDLLNTHSSALPLQLDDYVLNVAEQHQLKALLATQDFSLGSSLQQIWYLMDKVWDEFGLDNQALDHDKLQHYYSHPVWLLNGLFTEVDPESIEHRKLMGKWLGTTPDIKRLVDVGGGIGFLAKTLASYSPSTQIEVLEPYPSDYAQRVIKDIGGVSFVSELQGKYDGFCLMDVLEHVEDPIGMLHSILAHLQEGGYLLTGNCFQPVIKCHLPATFHLHYSFRDVVQALGVDFVERLDGSHVEVFRKTRPANMALARQQEKLSRSIYANTKKDISLLSQAGNHMQLNASLSKLYAYIDKLAAGTDTYIIYGAGTGARVLTTELTDKVSFIVDKNPNLWGTFKFNKAVKPLDSLKDSNEKIIIAAFGREGDIHSYLTQTLGIPHERIIQIPL